MKFRHLLFITGLLFYNRSYSQVYEFIVCGTHGVNSVKSDGVWKILKPSETFDHFDEIKTSGEDCYLGLLHSSGKSIVIRKPGTYNAEDLLKKVNTGNTEIASKYADFVFTKLTTINTQTTTSKTRSIDDNKINLFIPNSGQVFGNEQIIRWTGLDGANSYILKIKNLFDDALAEYSSDKPWFKLNLDDPVLKNQNSIFLSVALKSDSGIQSNVYAITRIPEDQYKKISDTFEKLKSELTVDSPINNLIIASFFEQNKLYIDAGTYLDNFIQTTPDTTESDKIYHEFVARNGLE